MMLIGVGIMLIGYLRWSMPNLTGETLVSPRKVRRSPEWAAEEHERRAKLLGLLGIAIGGIFIVAGFVGP